MAKTDQLAPKAKFRNDYQPPYFTIATIDLDFQLDDHKTRVISRMSVSRNGDHQHALVLDGQDLTLTRVEIDGKELTASDFKVDDESLTIATEFSAFELVIETEIDPANNTYLEGLYKSGGLFCTQCEAEGFRRITYYLDRPDVMAVFSTRITAPQDQYPFLLSNGNKVDSGQLRDGRHWVQWHDPFPKPAYLFALVAGQLDVLRDHFVTRSGRKVTLEVFVDPGNLDRAPHAMASLKRSMAWDEQRFGLEYDLDIYMIVAVDFFNMGAMENKGLNIFNAKFVLANALTATDMDHHNIEAVIGHEYFHNWTGNRVTCRDWFQLSLKEGLTVFRDQEFSSDLGSRAVNRIQNVRLIRSVQFNEDSGPMSHPIRPDKVIEMNNFYTVTVYEKGAEVIRMIHTLLGEEQFQQGMKLYFRRHDGTAATCDDFVAAMADANGRDLTQFKRWYSQSGTPVVHAVTEYNPAHSTLTLTLKQHTPPTADQDDKQALHIPIDIELLDEQGKPVVLIVDGQVIDSVLNLTEFEQTFVFEGVHSRPVLSILRQFSAPVRLEFDTCDEDLQFLIRHASDQFARWDALQMLTNKWFVANVERKEKGLDTTSTTSLVESLHAVLVDDSLDPAFRAELLTLPGVGSLFELFDQIPVDAILSVKNSLEHEVAKSLVADLKLTITQCHAQLVGKGTVVDHASAGWRSLRYVSLKLLALAEPGRANEISRTLFHNAENMTDSLAALHAGLAGQLDCYTALMDQFSEHWQHDGLVMDKWFSLQAQNPSDQCIENIQALYQHPAFEFSNPNRLRALVGSFAQLNAEQFHASDGRGYRFLTGVLVELNTLNPQVASRLIDPLLKWRRFDEQRGQHMRSCLQELQSLPELAKDLFEKIDKALT